MTTTINSNGAGTSATILEAENLTAVTTVIASSNIVGATIVYSISTSTAQNNIDAAQFSINPTTGVLTFITAPTLKRLQM